MAFADADGGVIAVGLHDGAVEGTRAWSGTLTGPRQAALDFTEPAVRVS